MAVALSGAAILNQKFEFLFDISMGQSLFHSNFEINCQFQEQ